MLFKRADTKLSLSPMIFSHNLVLLIFVEQLYRALSIHNRLLCHHA
ncbi:MAG: 23S rRNA (pseudouridine(1915)-N(3))-methyltransferase RlmH [Flavobacteriales bacterium]